MFSIHLNKINLTKKKSQILHCLKGKSLKLEYWNFSWNEHEFFKKCGHPYLYSMCIKVQKRQMKFSAISPVTGTSMQTRSTDTFSAHHQSDTGLKNWDKPNNFSADFVFIYFWVKKSEILVVKKLLKRHFLSWKYEWF